MQLPEKSYQFFLDHNPTPRELKNYDLVEPAVSSVYVKHHNKTLINFSSSDYLGLAHHPDVIARAQEFTKYYGAGSTSSRLVTGNFSFYTELEEKLAEAVGKPAALILGTGFQTNFSVLDALLDPIILGAEPLVLCDRLCHISMLAGTRHLKRIHRFQHNDLQHLQNLLEKYADQKHPIFILAESVYSMEGDTADLPGLITLAKKHHAFLYIDDAHAVGIYGPSGWGKAAEYSHDIDMIMGTFSKGLGGFGGYVACSLVIRDYLINKCKGFIYSTGLSPAILGAISAAIELQPMLDNQRQHLLKSAQRVREFFHTAGLACGTTNTHIIPWIIGDAEKTLRASKLLEDLGILGATIRPPSVSIGKSRIRFCLSAAHSEADIDQLLDAIQKVEQRL